MPIVCARRRLAACLAVLSGLVAAPAPAQPVSALHSRIQPGLWEYRVAGEGPHRLCVATIDALVRIRHPGRICEQRLVADGASSATVHYSCVGAGWGRTTFRVSTPTSVRLSTQGIAGNAPFAFDAQARRLGDCAARMASR